MQLPPQDELVLVSSHPPIRARKLRYYEDGNFTRRVRPAPALNDDGPYRDRPAPRHNDWGRQVCDAHLDVSDAETGLDATDEGGRGQERAVGDEDAAAPTTAEPEVESVPDDGFAGDDALSRLRQAATARAHAMNEGDHHPRHDDILPAF
jgi:type IV secretion system protein VirD4